MDLAAVEAEVFFQYTTDVVDHFFQSADVGIEVAAAGEKLLEQRLHVAALARPIGWSAAEGGNEVEMAVLGGELLEFLAVEDGFGMADAEKKPDFAVDVGSGSEELGQHAAHRRYTCAGGDEDQGSLDGAADDEKTVRAGEIDLGAGLDIAKEIGEQAARNAVQAEVETGVGARGGGDGISAGVLVAIALERHRNELAGHEIEWTAPDNLPFEMAGGFGEHAGGAEHGAIFAGDGKLRIWHGFVLIVEETCAGREPKAAAGQLGRWGWGRVS